MEKLQNFPFTTFFLFVFYHGDKNHHFSLTIAKVSLSECESVVSYLIIFINNGFCSTFIALEGIIS